MGETEHEHDLDEQQPDASPELAPDELEDQEREAALEEGAQHPPEAAQPKGDDQKAVRDLEKKIVKEREQHAKRLGTILGEASTDTLPCPLCFHGLMGFVLPGDADTMPDDQRAAALAFLGVDGGGELQPAEGVIECDRCNGFGQLKYPTRNVHLETQTCPKCTGNGYVLEHAPASNVTQLQPGAPAPVFDVAAPVGPCPLCNAPNSAGRPHFCNPGAATGT
jgi:hypothetical protein